MSASRKIQHGGGDSLPVYSDGDQIKTEQKAERPSTVNPYEGSPQHPTETGKTSAREEEKISICPHTEEHVEQPQSQQDYTTDKSVPHRRHEDQRHLLQFDYPREVTHAKKSLPKSTFPTTLMGGISDEEMESSPLIEDKSKEIRLARQREYQQELSQQIAQREEMRQQQRAKKSFRTSQRSQAAHAAAAAEAVAARNRLSVESYENQLRMEQLEGMRKQLQLQREREIQRLRRIYRKDDKRFLANLQRLNLQDSDPYSQAKGDGIVDTQREIASLKEKPLPSVPESESKTKASLKRESESKPEVTKPKHDVDVSHAGATKAASPRKLRHEKKAETKEKEVTLKSHQSPSTSIDGVEKPPTKPLTYKQAYLRLQKQRREEEMKLEERRAKAAAWRADRTRQERLEREMRNLAEWRSGHSLAGVSLTPVAPAQRARFEAVSSWLDKQRAAQQEKRVQRDRQLMNWREEKNALIKERRLKEKAEQNVAREIQIEKKKEAEKCYDRWLHEIRARKAAERASVPRGAIGVSTYSSTYSLPSPQRQLQKQSRRRKSIMSTSLKRKGNDDVPQ